ncbi:uncharacterized protein L969DRAFT_86963 [Mixia osmundae IAM 14324]|uniref:Transketolase-like pyrimidine-binding domain-containing protein n=1 Tax=Mixia osmundae (strain CBS 9802 / IAM 14324 / JCM 22182 / KY 12970) TaxID=764103 RepID=G7DVE0_MIXOS|nr:uncharacterized protein L969DRAFT_86963 [Mixia osmundae IAM 14324]KEI40328.1 hypothetical protein L969DRAFT_86963 [Mixia osmundae IAM 14324]GAA94550.1 hypothetical protein E5Q_01202 [Mixia osmundae IAM 14324]
MASHSDFSDFPVDLSKFKKLSLDPKKKTLSEQERSDLLSNIKLFRDAIVFFTATGAARGVSGHTGGPYDTAPEVNILLAFFNHSPAQFLPIFFDEAGHRVATQYLLSVLNGDMPASHLLNYRAASSKLPGHPELGLTPGIKFSSGRLGHMWPLVNGVALANSDKNVILLGSDGSQQEGDDAEAARLAVAKGLNVKLLIDDNDVTIAGHPSQYMPGYSVAKTLAGHGLKVFDTEGEDIDKLYASVCDLVAHDGPTALIVKRVMCPGIDGLEGSTHGHDVIPVPKAIKYLKDRGYPDTVGEILSNIKPAPNPYLYTGVSKELGACRVEFGDAVNAQLDKMTKEEAARTVMCIDSDLEGSTGLKKIHEKHPEVFQSSGIMERGNFSAAAGFGFGHESEKQGIFSTFTAFSEMITSELTMARLNFCNVLTHFSHSGCDEMADNTCHFGINSFFLDNGLLDAHETRMYFPADPSQLRAVIDAVFKDRGIRFVFSTRSKVPWILREGTQEKLYEGDYKFVPCKDEYVRTGKAGTIVTYGEMTYRCLDAVERLRAEGYDIALVNKVTMNVVDEDAIKEYGSSPFVLVVESANQKTGLGSKMGTWLLERGLKPTYGYMGTNKEGCGGLSEQIFHQGLGPQDILLKAKSLSNASPK